MVERGLHSIDTGVFEVVNAASGQEELIVISGVATWNTEVNMLKKIRVKGIVYNFVEE